jgi:hypothetical protein
MTEFEITRNNETEILRRTVEALLAMPAATGIDVDDGDDEYALYRSTDFEAIKDACFAVDECYLFTNTIDGKRQYVYFIWGNGNNGLDAITDYTVGLKEALKPVNDWIEQREWAYNGFQLTVDTSTANR